MWTVLIGTLNINSLSSKFEQLKVIIGNYLDVLIIQETKDRFGPIPKNVELLRFVTRIRILAENAGIERISSNDDLVTIMLTEPTGGAKQALSNILGENVTVGNQQIRIGINREDLLWVEHLSDTIERIQSFRDGMIEAMKKTMSQATRWSY